MALIDEAAPKTAGSTPPTPGKPQRSAAFRTRAAFAGIVAGNFMVLLDATILNVALPDMKAHLHASAAALPWTVDAYTVVFAGLMLASGAVADRFGARRVYQSAVALFGLLSLLCALAPNVGGLIAGRALLGAAAAGMVPASLSLLAGLYPDAKDRMKAVGAWAALSGIGLAVGPVLGGALVAAGGWRLVFVVNPPLALVSWFLVRGLSSQASGHRKKFDIPGLVLFTVALCALTYGLVDAGTEGWSTPSALVALAVAVLAAVAVAFVERRAETPVLPPELLRLGRVRTNLVTAVAANYIFYGLLYSVTLWFEETRHMSAAMTGVAFLPMMVPLCFLPFFTSRLAHRFGARPMVMVAMVVNVGVGAVLFTVGAHTSLAVVTVAQVLMAIATTLTIPSITADMAVATPRPLAATGQGALNAARQTGSALGVAILGTMSGMHAAGIAMAAGALLTLVLAGLTRRSA
ncbi:major facilitator superfamily MFS_1 [Catenulispora acidiphila DSM 44928]|uniref:Major facilitator superfamily MFS_1 n=1 Tax=Catenulispora acidiphila (strain DSM 44928 / JCM 14897 / NBRC 102108 / NRRL B-24433 / ID139908) TaxID=479433 RepID=C7QH10_CATAD|nr:MFS transporter [Catenulispora acidiphila]ACU76860.1 major facilitator superfamily MFS_1 [Catenulispora acidiphila DSM 44928]